MKKQVGSLISLLLWVWTPIICKGSYVGHFFLWRE